MQRDWTSAEVIALVAAHPEWGCASTDGVRLLGAGESYAAWLLPGPPDLTLRLARRPLAQLPADPAAEVAAMRLAPAGVAPTPVHVGGDAVAELAAHRNDAAGAAVREASGDEAHQWPYQVLTHSPGRVLDTAAWAEDDGLRGACARRLAHLHTVTFPGAGDVLSAESNRGGVSLLADLAGVLDYWSGRWPAAVEAARAEGLISKVSGVAERAEESAIALDSFSLLHGDPCLTNIVVDHVGVPHLIDWEWARIGDPARDLAFIGGAVHAPPWYAPLREDQVVEYVAGYLAAAGPDRAQALGGPEQVRLRRDAWLALEGLGVLLYVRWLTGDPGQHFTERHRRLAQDLSGRLTAL